MVLAIMGVRGVELVESNGRKCVFLAAAARRAAAAVTIRHARVATLRAAPAVAGRATPDEALQAMRGATRDCPPPPRHTRMSAGR